MFLSIFDMRHTVNCEFDLKLKSRSGKTNMIQTQECVELVAILLVTTIGDSEQSIVKYLDRNKKYIAIQKKWLRQESNHRSRKRYCIERLTLFLLSYPVQQFNQDYNRGIFYSLKLQKNNIILRISMHSFWFVWWGTKYNREGEILCNCGKLHTARNLLRWLI